MERPITGSSGGVDCALLVGVGGVGEAIARMIVDHSPWLRKVVLADYNLARAADVAARLPGAAAGRFPVEQLDASKRESIEAVARKHGATLIINACEPGFVENIFDAAFNVGAHYVDMAMSLSTPHATKPYEVVGKTLGEYQLAQHAAWEAKGQLALIGLGVEPGMSDVFARYAADHLGFAEIDEIGVRDGANLVVEGYDFAPSFSIWTTIEECLNAPVVYERSKGWFTTEPFSEPEIFDFPGGIGPVEVVNVEHEEVLLVPRWIPRVGRVTFKFGLGTTFINVLKTLHQLGLDRKDKVRVRGAVDVAPRDVVAACLPDPAKIGHLMKGKTCAGTLVRGRDAAGAAKEVYLYQIADNQACMARWGCQAVVAQTAFNLVLGLDLLFHTGAWSGKGVLGPEAFPAPPFLAKMGAYGFPWGLQHRVGTPTPATSVTEFATQGMIAEDGSSSPMSQASSA